MNILQIVSRMDESDEALDTKDLTRFLTLHGHKAIVSSQGGSLVGAIDEVGARHYKISLKKNPFSIAISVFKLAQLIRRENIQIVHSRDELSSVVAFFASRLTEKPFIATVYKWQRSGFLQKTQFWARVVTCFDEIAARRLVEKNAIPQSKLCVISPFVDTEKFKFTSRQNRLHHDFTLGAALPLSSFEEAQNFIKAVSIVSRSVNNIKVLVIGTGTPVEKDFMERLRLLIRRHSLEKIVEFPADENAIASTFPGMDLFVQINTDKETSTRYLLRATSCGVPVIATETSWIKEYVEEGKSAVFTKADNPHDMTEKVLGLYRDSRLRAKITSGARKTVEQKFQVKAVMKSIMGVYEGIADSMNILVVKIGALGDTILVIPSLRAIRKKFPKAKIKVLVGLEQKDIFNNCPFVDEVIVCDFKERDRGLKGFFRIARRLRLEGFDMSMDLQNNKKSHALSFLSFAPKRYGYDNGKFAFFLNRKVRDTKEPMDPVTHQAKVLGLAGIFTVDKKLELWPSKEDRAWADNFLKTQWVKDSHLVAFNIGASKRWSTKLWPPEYFAEVAEKLAAEHNIRVMLIGRETENERVNKFLQHTNCKPIIALGKTNIPRLASLMEKCDLLLTSDSAPMHIAAAVRTPFIALFGPTNPVRHLPPAEKFVAIKKNIKCSPCYHTRCSKRYACMQSITPDEVYKAILKTLGVKDKK